MKLKEVTPASYSCVAGACPSVYETDRGTFLIIGNRIEVPGEIPRGKISDGETIIEVPADLIRGVAVRKQE